MKEYVALVEEPKDIQMKLNQWKHQYNIEVINSNYFEDTQGFIKLGVLLTRTKK